MSIFYQSEERPPLSLLVSIFPPVPVVLWEKAQYVVLESERSVEVCVALLGTLKREAEVHLTTTDITAIGMLCISCIMYSCAYLLQYMTCVLA